MYVINHGFTPAQVSGCDLVVNEWQLICSQTDRIFDIANASFAGMTDADKTQFASRIEQDGSYQGYKAPQYWVSILGSSRHVILIIMIFWTQHIGSGVHDRIELYTCTYCCPLML